MKERKVVINLLAGFERRLPRRPRQSPFRSRSNSVNGQVAAVLPSSGAALGDAVAGDQIHGGAAPNEVIQLPISGGAAPPISGEAARYRGQQGVFSKCPLEVGREV